MKKTFIIFSSIFVIILAVGIYNINYLTEEYIKDELDNIIANSSQGIYEFKYKDVDFHVLNGNFEISGVEIVAKRGVSDSVKNGYIKSYISFKLNKLSVNGLSFLEYYETKNIKINEIKIVEPQILYSFNPNVDEKAKAFNLAKLFNERLKSIRVEKFNFVNVNFDFNNVLRKNLLLDIDSMSLVINNMVFDSISITNKIPINYSDFNIVINKSSANISKYYMLETDKLTFSTEHKTLKLDSINIIPKYTIKEFHSIIPYEKGYLKLKANELQINNINIDSIIKNQRFYFDKLIIDKLKLNTYKDKRIKDAPYKYKKLLSQIIREIPVDFKIDTIKVKNSYFKVQLISQKVSQTKPGNIFFNSVFINIYDLTNDSAYVKKYPYLKIYFSSKFMNVANLNAQIIMPVFNYKNSFRVKGQLAEMDVNVLNELLERLLLVKVKSGVIRSVDFEYKADNDSAKGFVDISYQNLKLDIKSEKTPGKSLKFINLLINTVAKTDNIKGTPNFTRGFIRYKRDNNKRFINYLWLSLQNGITNTFLKSKNIKSQSKEYKKGNKKNNKLFQNWKKDND